MNDHSIKASNGLIRYCCFHPEYGYENFIEGYWPKECNGQVTFELRNGIFKQLCEDAENAPEQSYFLVIDEINRGDIPRIFGELLTLLEADKRGISFHLPVSGELFHVPPNLFIIGTMNTADRSIALLDTALRRRFGFIELMPDVNVLDDVVLEGIPVRLWLKELNRRICENIGQDARNLQIGHSYLMHAGKTVSKFSLFAKIVQNDIIPLLEEYCYENYDILQRLLGSSIVDVSSWRICHEIFESQDQAALATALLSSCPDIAASISAIEAAEELSIEEDEHSVEEAEKMDDKDE